MKSLRKIGKSIKAWDQKNTSFHSSTYMLIFITASMSYLSMLQNALAVL